MSSEPSKESNLKFNTASLLKVAKANGITTTQAQKMLTALSQLNGFNNIDATTAEGLQKAISNYNTKAVEAGYKGNNAFQDLTKSERAIVSVDQLKGIDQNELRSKENKDLSLKDIQFASEVNEAVKKDVENAREQALENEVTRVQDKNLSEAADEFVSNNKGFKKEKSGKELMDKVKDREDSIRNINIRTAGRILGTSDKEISKTLVADINNRGMDTELGKKTAEFLSADTKALRKKLADAYSMSEGEVESAYNALKAEIIDEREDASSLETRITMDEAKKRNKEHYKSKIKATFTEKEELKAQTDSYDSQYKKLLKDNKVSNEAIAILTDRTGVYSKEEKARVLKEQTLDEDTIKKAKILNAKAQKSSDAEYAASKKQESTSQNLDQVNKQNVQATETKQEATTIPEEKAQTFGRENMANAPAINNKPQEKESNTKQTITVNLILGKEEIAKITRAIEGEKSGTGGA